MTHISLYRKYRPATFEEVVGQEHVTRTLVGAITTGKISHAYLFAGSRGTGKTSTAKLLAKALNCAQGPTAAPCGQCESCRAIGAGASMDVIEMDAASNRGIDDIRDIRDKVAFATVEGKYRVYILDEAHMLTKEASNAFLKVLEEPPAHVIFVLCTTEAHKVIPTIQSRCQKFEFRRPDPGMILQVLGRVASAEGIEIDEAGLLAIARGSGGAFRDAIGTLDQLATFSDKKISLSDVLSMLGTVESELLFEAVDIAAGNDTRGALLFVNRLAERGRDLGQFSQELIGHLRNVFLAQQLEDHPETVVSAPEEELLKIKAQARTISPAGVLRFVELLSEACDWMRQGGDPRLQLELAFIRMTQPQVDMSKKSMLYRIEQLEEKLKAGGLPSLKPAPDQPSDEAAAARPGNADELSLDKLTRAWSVILDQVKKQKIPLYSVLKEGRPLELEGGLLTIGFPAGAAFHKSQVEKPDNTAVLTGVLKEMTGTAIRIRCEAATEAAAAATPAADGSEAVPSMEEMIAKIKDEFGAEEI